MLLCWQDKTRIVEWRATLLSGHLGSDLVGGHVDESCRAVEGRDGVEPEEDEMSRVTMLMWWMR